MEFRLITDVDLAIVNGRAVIFLSSRLKLVKLGAWLFKLVQRVNCEIFLVFESQS